ncbi:MAG: preprotein translocase subunit SecG [Chloroflexi bacterium]|uniref:Protein-export membrane protein SecG n=1 Tax=Candidatus Chlorohelix allophototropha TaxID=3003348 RepID=A0A8T7M618_9CHLR|nr:preprotein translocase subunit SecG [Chloroflexota bacterium]WJW69459.1 preprotein translocase subunit SecG [Chloroflexota bacterium L227-S17]
MGGFLNVIQLILAIFIIVLILLQSKGSGITSSSAADSSKIFSSRRGFELRLFQFTILFSIIFALVALSNSLIKQ